MAETKIYSIYIPQESTQQHISGKAPEPSLIITVTAPRYLFQPYIVTRTSPYEIHISKTAKWESTPVRIIRQELSETMISLQYFKGVRISQSHTTESYWLTADLKRFECIHENQNYFAELTIEVVLFNEEMDQLFSQSIASKQPLKDKAADGLAHALSTSLADTLQTIKLRVMQVMVKNN